MSHALQIIAALLGIVGTIIAYMATVNPEWAKSDVSGNVLETQKTTVGLWESCVHLTTGFDSCDKYDNLLLGSDKSHIIARFFCIMSIILGIFGTTVFIFGMTCAQLGSSPGAKRKMRCSSGVMILVGGALILIAGSFMGWDIVQHYERFRPSMNYNAGMRGRRSLEDVSFYRVARDAGDESVDGDSVMGSSLDAFLDECSAPGSMIRCDCGDSVECKDALAERERMAKKGRKQFKVNQALTFGIGCFLAWIGGAIQMAAGGIMLSQGCGGGDEEDEADYGGYNYDNRSNNYNQGSIVNNQQKRFV